MQVAANVDLTAGAHKINAKCFYRRHQALLWKIGIVSKYEISALKNVSDTPPWGPAHLLAPCNRLYFKNSIGFTLSHNPEALSNSASTLILHLLFPGQNVSQHVLCVNHPHTRASH